MNKDIKKFFLRILAIGVLFALCDQGIGLILDQVRDHSPDGRYYKTAYSLDRSNEDVIILGSSRGEINYAPYLIEESLHLSCWDASRGGQGLPYMHAIEEGILNRYNPKVFILNVEADILEYPPFYQEAGFLRPFYKNHREIQPEMDKISPLEHTKLYSRLYAYNSSFYYLLRPYLFHDLDGKISDKGWKPRDGQMHDPGFPFEIVDNDRPLNPEAVEELETMVQELADRGIELFLVISPNYGEKTVHSSTIDYLTNLSKERDIPLFNFATDSTFVTHPELFIDIQHLNRTGAEIFTKKLIEKIKESHKV